MGLSGKLHALKNALPGIQILEWEEFLSEKG
jgi:hypothetical protein